MTSTGRLYRVALGGGATVAMAAAMLLASTVSASAATVRVHMHEFQFCPEDATGTAQCPGALAPAGNGGVVTINPGDNVTWVWDESATDLTPNCDSVPFAILNAVQMGCPGHTVSAPGQPFGVSCAAPGGVPGCPYSYTFGVSGTFHYFCAYHGGRTQANNPNNPLTNMDGTVVVRGSGTTGDNPTTTNAGSGGVLGATASSSGGGAQGQALPNTAVPGLPNAGRLLADPGPSLRALLVVFLLAPLAALLIRRLRRS